MTNSPWKVHRTFGGWEAGSQVWREVTGMRNGLGWCLPMESTAGNLWIVFAQIKKSVHGSHVDTFGQHPELLWGYTVNVWSTRRVRSAKNENDVIFMSLQACVIYFILKARHYREKHCLFMHWSVFWFCAICVLFTFFLIVDRKCFYCTSFIAYMAVDSIFWFMSDKKRNPKSPL